MVVDFAQLAEGPGLLVLIDNHKKAAVQKCSAAFLGSDSIKAETKLYKYLEYLTLQILPCYTDRNV